MGRQKDKKKGFTLIELLGVLVILSAIIGLVFSNFSSSLEQSKEKREIEKIETLKSFSEIYVTDNRKKIYEWLDVEDEDNSINKCYISILRLKEKGYLPSNIYKEIKSGYIIYDKVENSYAYAEEKNGLNSCVEDDRDEYLVTFDANGGTVSPDKMQVTYGKKYGDGVSDLPKPVRYGYSSEGWYTEKDGGKKITKNTRVSLTADQTLYAHWKLGTYTVTLDPTGGTVNKTNINVTYSEKYGTLPEPIRAGYKFTGWYTSITGGGKIEEESIVEFGENHTLYAGWEISSYTIKFDANGGTVSRNSQVVNFGEAYGKNEGLPIPSNSCYIFTGWYTEKDGGDLVNESTIVTKMEEHTLYAHWTSGNYMVAFDPNDGVVTPTNKNVICGSTYGLPEKLPIPSYTGHTFAGWYTAKTNGTKITDDSVVSITGTQTLYARWVINNYTVTFNANGGSVSTSSKNVTYGSTYGTLPEPVRSGYVFIGWYTAISGGTQIMSGSAVSLTSNQTLYAHWTSASQTFSYTGTIQSYTVPVSGTYKLEVWGAQGCRTAGYGTSWGDCDKAKSAVGGKGGYSYGNATLRQGDVVYVVVGQSPADANGGYNGGGGGYETGGGGGATHIAKESGLLENLSSKKSSILIVAGGGGGNGRGTESNYNYTGGAGGGTAGGVTDKGELFAGGSAGSQSSGYAFGKGSSASAFCGGGGGGGYYGGSGGGNYNGGRPGGGGSGYIGGVTGGSTSNGVRSGHGAATITLVKAVVEDTSGFVITFNANGGSVSTGSKIVGNGETYGGMPVPTRLGYIFKGWYTQISGGTQILSTTVASLSANQTLYAHWEVEPNSLVVYQASTDGTVTVNNSAYVNVPNYVISPGVWYWLGTDSKSTVVNINYGGYKSVEIEYTIGLNNCDAWWDGQRRTSVSIAGNVVYDSTNQAYEGQNPYYYTYKGSATSVTAVGTATNEDHTETWVQVNIYVTKITLKK